MTVDIHAHTIPIDYVHAVARDAPEVGPSVERGADGWYLVYPSGHRSGPVLEGMFDTQARLADMDRQGVTVQALSVPPTHFFYDHAPEVAAASARAHNDAMLAMAREHPDRFSVLLSLPLQSEELSHQELERLADDEHVRGVQIGTNVAGVPLHDPSLASVWQALDARGMAVVLHPHDVAGRERMLDFYLHNFVGNPTDSTLAAGHLIFGGVLGANPTLRVALLHGGGFLPYQIGRFEHGWSVRRESREHLAVSPRELFARLYFDTLTHDAASLRFLLERVGVDRLMLGSDYPFDMADDAPVESVRAALGDGPGTAAVLTTTPRTFLSRNP